MFNKLPHGNLSYSYPLKRYSAPLQRIIPSVTPFRR